MGGGGGGGGVTLKFIRLADSLFQVSKLKFYCLASYRQKTRLTYKIKLIAVQQYPFFWGYDSHVTLHKKIDVLFWFMVHSHVGYDYSDVGATKFLWK